MFELYATGEFSLAQLVKATRQEFGCSLAKGYVHKLLMYPFYRGKFEWRWVMYLGKQERIIPALVCEQVDAVLHRANRPRYEKHRFAFAGLLTCAHDGCIVTAETKKQKYTYYHCTGYRGRCDLPYMREESLGRASAASWMEFTFLRRQSNRSWSLGRMPPTMLPKNGKERLFTWAEVSRRYAGRNSRPMKTN